MDCVISRSSSCSPTQSWPPQAAPEYGSYELFIPQNIDDRLETELYDAVRESLVAARIRRTTSIAPK